MMTALRLFATVILFWTLPLAAENTDTADQAKNHIGERAPVCGLVASTHFAALTNGQPMYLNLDKPYPNQVFTILIWGSDRGEFGTPDRDYSGKNRKTSAS